SRENRAGPSNPRATLAGARSPPAMAIRAVVPWGPELSRDHNPVSGLLGAVDRQPPERPTGLAPSRPGRHPDRRVVVDARMAIFAGLLGRKRPPGTRADRRLGWSDVSGPSPLSPVESRLNESPDRPSPLRSLGTADILPVGMLPD